MLIKKDWQKLNDLILILISSIFTESMEEQKQITKINFQNFRDKINSKNTAEEKRELVDSLLISIKETGYPIVEDDSTVILLYSGDSQNIELIGDMTNWEYGIPMTKIEGANLFYLKVSYEPTARLEYWLRISEKDFPFVDSLNPYKSLNGFGEISELAMPKYNRHPYFNEFIYGKKGSYDSLKEFDIPSKILSYTHTIHLYTPPNYDRTKKYSTVYFQDGRDYIEFAMTPHILNELINSKLIEPVIAVFVTPPNLHQPKVPNRMTEYGLNDEYVKFFVDELVPFIDSKYSTMQDSKNRLVVGDSFGGLISTYITFSHPKIFNMAYSQSGYHSFQKDNLIKLFEKANKKDIKLYADVGTYERKVGSSFLPADETDFLEGNRRFKKVLEEKKYNFIYNEYYEGHTWGNWRRHLIDALIYFLGYEGNEK